MLCQHLSVFYACQYPVPELQFARSNFNNKFPGVILTRLFQSVALYALLSVSISANALTDQPEQSQPGSPPPLVTAPGPHFILNAGITYGGDTVATANYKDGGSTSIKGGGLLQFGLGALYQFETSPLAIMLSANYHTDSSKASNGDMSFTRTPIELLAYYTGVDHFRIGGGARFVSSPEASLTINGSTEKTSYDNTTGIVAEIGYHTQSTTWLNFRYVSEKYQGNTYTSSSGAKYSLAGSKKLDGSHFGVNLTLEF